MLKYQIIANEIEHNIYSNNLPQGTKLPTVETLASDYKVSKSTIQRNCLPTSRKWYFC